MTTTSQIINDLRYFWENSDPEFRPIFEADLRQYAAAIIGYMA